MSSDDHIKHIPSEKFKRPGNEHVTFFALVPAGQKLRFEVIADGECQVIANQKSFPGYWKDGVAPLYVPHPEEWCNLSLVGDLIIPSEVEFQGVVYTVVGIDSYAFKNCPGLTSVFLPDTVKSIARYAFVNSHKLSSVTVPKGIVIDHDASMNCKKIKFVFNNQ